MVEIEVKTPVLTRIEEFHGHIGPYVVLGYKMGLMARDLLDSPGYFDLTVKVETPLIPPPSCLIDGIQLGSGCTTGKGNLMVVEGPIGKATFCTQKDNTVMLSLRADIPEKVRQWIGEIGVERSGKRILETPTKEFIEQLD
ncbi:MAG: formylmethanofuran dehydrogenase subunit E family protein [bacterium]